MCGVRNGVLGFSGSRFRICSEYVLRRTALSILSSWLCLGLGAGREGGRWGKGLKTIALQTAPRESISQ